MNDDIVKQIDPQKIAEEICRVQPMSAEASNAWFSLYKASKKREDLIKEGYKPVSRLGLMWSKDE